MKVTYRLAGELSRRFGLGDRNDWLTKDVEVAEGKSLQQLLESLAAADSRLDGRLYDRHTGKQGPEVWIVFNGRALDPVGSSLDIKLSDGDRVTVVPGPEG